jgi:hypothetical protein
MKRKFSLLLLTFGMISGIKSQVVLTENFNSPFSLQTSGWAIQNNSTPAGNQGWFQGNGFNTFPAFNGGPNDYYAANFNSTAASNSTGVISAWLISPVVTLMNGATIEFATRTINSATVYPDGMQVRISPVANYTLPSGATSVGTFSNLVFDINPSLSTTATAVQTGSTVNGYPQSWTTYTATVSGITGTVTGRIAFRYFVTGAGPVGGNSNFIGLDAVKCTSACLPQATISIAQTNTAGVCSGGTVGLTASSSGSFVANTYTWSNGATTPSIAVSPSVTTVYTVSGETSAGCISTRTTVVTVTVTPVIKVPSYTVCASTPITLLASGASSYSWNTGATTASISVTPSVTTVYNVISGGTLCPGAQTSTITIGTQLSMDINASATTICAGKVVTLTAVSAASSFSWSSGGTVPTITVSPASNTTYTVVGLSGLCAGVNTVAIVVNANPTISVTSPSALCSQANFTSTASGTGLFTFYYGPGPVVISSSSAAALSAPFASAITVSQLTVSGTGTNGCVATVVNSITINPNPVVLISASKLTECKTTTSSSPSVTLTASGASTYSWTGGGSNATLIFPTASVSGTSSYTVTGTSAGSGCFSRAEITITISDCLGLEAFGNSQGIIRAYPNPFNEDLKISGLEGYVEIYNMLGQKLTRVNLTEEITTVNTQEFNKGIYILKAYSTEGKELKSLKLIKN